MDESGTARPERFRTGSVLLVAGGVVAATGIALVFVGRAKEKRSETPPIAVLPGPNGLLIEGRF